MIQVWKIDENSFFTGESYFVDETIENYVENEFEVEKPYTIGYVHGKWNGTEWIEGATPEEIQAWQESQQVESQPTETEMLMLALAELDAEREADKLETQLALAELTTLLGGN